MLFCLWQLDSGETSERSYDIMTCSEGPPLIATGIMWYVP